MSQLVYLSLGSNVGDREGNLRAAVAQLRSAIRVEAVSSLYETEPVGVTDQPAFLNLAVAAHTDLAPRQLLEAVKRVERRVGRKPTYRWGPRVIDIDIVLYDALILETPELTLPHARLAERAFVLVPLAEIAPEAVEPRSEKRVVELSEVAPGRAGVRRFGPAPCALPGSAAPGPRVEREPS
jgi:2-amino-4-hydroxy-6-hydroxymethyldihydropteridine diphosphokinase